MNARDARDLRPGVRFRLRPHVLHGIFNLERIGAQESGQRGSGAEGTQSSMIPFFGGRD